MTFNPLYTASLSELKINQLPLRPDITHYECATMIASQAKLFENHMRDDLSRFMGGHTKKKEKRYKIPVPSQDDYVS